MGKVVITGSGPISAIGIDQECFSAALTGGECGILPIPTFATDDCPAHRAALVDGFEVDEFLPTPKNYLDRNTELAFGALSLALEDAELDLSECDCSRVALNWATAFAGTETIDRFLTDVRNKGARFGKPILFPHTYANTAISFLSIEYGLNGPHMQFSSGWTAGLEAVVYGLQQLRDGRAEMALCGAAEAMSQALFSVCLGQGVISESDSARPFASDADGTVAGEGAACFVLENAAAARARGAEIQAELAGAGMAAAPMGWSPEGSHAAIVTAMRRALAAAELEPSDIAAVYAAGCGLKPMDAAEGRALAEVFSENSATHVTSLVPYVGETFGASGSLNLAAALVTLKTGFIPALATPGPWRFSSAAGENVDPSPGAVLINALDPGGAVVSVVVRKNGGGRRQWENGSE